MTIRRKVIPLWTRQRAIPAEGRPRSRRQGPQIVDGPAFIEANARREMIDRTFARSSDRHRSGATLARIPGDDSLGFQKIKSGRQDMKRLNIGRSEEHTS